MTTLLLPLSLVLFHAFWVVFLADFYALWKKTKKQQKNHEKNQTKLLLTVDKTRWLRNYFLQIPVVSQKCPFGCNWTQSASSKVNYQKMHTHAQNKYKSESHILQEEIRQISGRGLKQSKDQNSAPKWKYSKLYITKATDQCMFLTAAHT